MVERSSLLLIIVLACVSTAEGNAPKVISPAEIPHYLLGGAMLRYVSGDFSHCVANFLNNDSFGFGLGLSPMYVNYNDNREQKWYSVFSDSEVVDGQWENLPGPANRYMYSVMVEDGAGFMYTDLDPRNDAPVTPIAFINCKEHGIGGSVIAMTDVGTPLKCQSELITALTSGYRVSFALDMNRCRETSRQMGNSSEKERSIYTGVVDNFRFNHKGDLATTSFLLNMQNVVVSWLEMRVSADNMAAVDVIGISTLDGEQDTDCYTCAVGPDKGLALFKLAK